jgi:hypothetical protein
MFPTDSVRHLSGALILCVFAGLVAGCGNKEPAPAASTQSDAPPAMAPADGTQAPGQPPAPLQATTATWAPEALEELLAPVALYPDPVLMQVLTAATNPQEVLDAGNWLIANPSLNGNALDEAAQQVGFTPPVRGLVQSPQVIDQMCLNMGWTEELGQAYVNDQAGVMDAVQRLRVQAQEVGTLASSDKMKVETVAPPEPSQPQVITISPPSPQVVHVPQYDPVAAYAPLPTTTTTTTTTEDKGHSTGAMVATGVLAFGAGILVSEIFEDDDDDDYWNNQRYGNMWYGPTPYYPPYPYRPAYGGGFHPSYGYNRPPNYGRGGNNNVVVVNQNNNYWNRYDNDRDIEMNRRQAQSPISAAKPNRNDLSRLNADAATGPKRPAPAAADAWKGQGGYAGADASKRPAVESRADAAKAKAPSAAPKVQGTYAGAQPSQDRVETAKSAGAARPAASPATEPAAKPAAKPAVASKAQSVDRGRVADAAPSRPAKPAAVPAARPASAERTAVSGTNRGAADTAASARGRESAPKGVPPQAKQRAGETGAAKRNR